MALSLPYDIRLEVARPDVAVITLRGELDLEAVPLLEAALSRVLDRRSRQVFIDASGADFISVRALTSIGQLLLGVDAVTLVAPGELPHIVLERLGFDGIVCVTVGPPDVEGTLRCRRTWAE